VSSATDGALSVTKSRGGSSHGKSLDVSGALNGAADGALSVTKGGSKLVSGSAEADGSAGAKAKANKKGAKAKASGDASASASGEASGKGLGLALLKPGHSDKSSQSSGQQQPAGKHADAGTDPAPTSSKTASTSSKTASTSGPASYSRSEDHPSRRARQD